jgi:hypothetical protein
MPFATLGCARSIDVGKLNRNGCLVTGWAGSWQWTRDSNQVATIGLTAHQGSLRLTYRWRLADNEWNDVEERVGIVWRNCPFGGRRPLFHCPGVVNGRTCGRSVLKLYGVGRYFLCRHCYRLSYASQSEDPWDRCCGEQTRSAPGSEANLVPPHSFPAALRACTRRPTNVCSTRSSIAKHSLNKSSHYLSNA